MAIVFHKIGSVRYVFYTIISAIVMVPGCLLLSAWFQWSGYEIGKVASKFYYYKVKIMNKVEIIQILQTFIGIVQSVFVLGAARWAYSYYTGKVGFSGQAEERRKNRVKKFGWLLILCITVLSLSGAVLFIFKIAELYQVINWIKR